MSVPPTGVLLWACHLSLALLALGLVAAFYRVVRGPSAPDRIAALDIIAGLTIGMVATYSVQTAQAELLNVAAALALIAFLGTVATARYLEKSLSR